MIHKKTSNISWDWWLKTATEWNTSLNQGTFVWLPIQNGTVLAVPNVAIQKQNSIRICGNALLTRLLQSICDLWSNKSTSCCFCQDKLYKRAYNLPSVKTLQILMQTCICDRHFQIKIPILVGIWFPKFHTVPCFVDILTLGSRKLLTSFKKFGAFTWE